ncbi:hypothetical protein CJ030_MR4G013701 [Morella rubra]|uniref:Uncharacterized protein n=1 Tax=Morella rubra TaxID=262757 RepID=A0A6A1WS36_9ROSI|nr:hypothetical protein CJ030_MR4G013701 [Morella rubra]
MKAEIDDLHAKQSRTSLELQVKHSKIGELQEEAHERRNQLLELMKTVAALRATRDEAVTEKTAALEKAQSLKKDLRLTRHNLQLIEADVISARLVGFQEGFETVNRVMQQTKPDHFTILPYDVLVVIALKATEDSIFDLLSLRGVCRVLQQVGAEVVVCQSCPIEELPNLSESLIQKIFVDWKFMRGFKMVTRSMEVGRPQGTYLYCMLELLTGEALAAQAKQVYHLLQRLRESYEMVWLREATILSWGPRPRAPYGCGDGFVT